MRRISGHSDGLILEPRKLCTPSTHVFTLERSYYNCFLVFVTGEHGSQSWKGERRALFLSLLALQTNAARLAGSDRGTYSYDGLFYLHSATL